MTEGKELDKLYEYGSKLLDSIERDFQSEIQKTDRLKTELEEGRKKFMGIATDLEYLLEKIKG